MGKYQRQRLLGKKIKKYNLVQQLGSGSYGSVYKAVVDSKSNQFLAIKVMSKTQMKQIKKLQQLVKSQINILSQVKSQNVIKYVDSFSSGDCVFIVTEFCNGGDLQQYCKKNGKIPQTQAVNFLKQILNGFKALHQINTMHRDFKLANVLLHNHVCKIADLGFAKQLKQKTLTVTQLGTDQTMAPEVHQGQKYGWGADIWSIGVVFYQMIYNRLPFSGSSDFEILRKIKTTTPKYDDADVSQQAVDFIKKCLVANPHQRISWKQIYEHQLMFKSDINLTAGILRSSCINIDKNKKYYDKNQDTMRKTINNGQGLQYTIKPKKQKDYFEDAGNIKSADIKADQIRKNKQDLESQLKNYQNSIIQKRNNIMFGISNILPLQKQLSKIQIDHSKCLYEICKNTYLQLKKYRNQITSQSYQDYKYWKQFRQQDIYKNVSDRLFDDQIFVEQLTVSYKHDLQVNNQNMNIPTDQKRFKQIVNTYRRELTPYLKKQSKKIKFKFIKMLKALKLIQQSSSWNSKKFDEQNKDINVQKEQKILLSKL